MFDLTLDKTIEDGIIRMNLMKQYSSKDMQRILRGNGYTLIRITGGHQIWGKNERKIAVTVSHLNPCVAKRIIKENCLSEV